MTGYQIIDPVIDAWCAKHRLVLFNEFGGQPRRFIYTSGAVECFQISIEPPEISGTEEIVRVNLWSIETVDDAEIHHVWLVPTGDLGTALEIALETAEMLKMRPVASQS